MHLTAQNDIVREMKQCIVLLFVAVLGAQAQTSPPAVVIRPPDSSTATETQTARFTCAAYGAPTPTISWVQAKGGLSAKLDDENSGYKVYTQTLVVNDVEFAISVLEICGVTMDTADTYTCSASNGVSGIGVADSSASFSLVVTASTKQPAALVMKASDVSADYGSSVEAVCVAYGNPIPTITWDRPSCPTCTDNLLLGAGSTTITNQIVNYGDVAFAKSTLYLCGVEKIDTGMFRCTAANGVSGDPIADTTGSWSLSVGQAPVMTSSTATRGAATSSSGPAPTQGASEQVVVKDERAYQAVVAIETIAIVILLIAVGALIVFIFFKSRQTSSQKPDIPRPPRDPHVRKEGFENPLHGDHDDAVDVDTMTYADLAKKLDD